MLVEFDWYNIYLLTATLSYSSLISISFVHSQIHENLDILYYLKCMMMRTMGGPIFVRLTITFLICLAIKLMITMK